MRLTVPATNRAVHVPACCCKASNRDISDSSVKGVWLEQRMARSKMKAAANQDLLLDEMKVVLVAPKHPSNVGAVARACDNFECGSLHVVAPRCDVFCDEVLKIACGSSLVENIKVHNDIQDAVSDVNLAVAFTRRSGAARPLFRCWSELNDSLPPPLALSRQTMCPTSKPQDALQQAVPAAADSTAQELPAACISGAGRTPPQHPAERDLGTVRSDPGLYLRDLDALAGSHDNQFARGYHTAFVFGREESGLSAEEVLACSHCCAIPSGRDQPSLNLSHSVAVVLAQVFDHLQRLQQGTSEASDASARGPDKMATMHDIHALVERWSRIAVLCGDSGELLRGGGVNHGRKISPVGQLLAILSQGPTTVAQVKGMHALAKSIEDRL